MSAVNVADLAWQWADADPADIARSSFALGASLLHARFAEALTPAGPRAEDLPLVWTPLTAEGSSMEQLLRDIERECQQLLTPASSNDHTLLVRDLCELTREAKHVGR